MFLPLSKVSRRTNARKGQRLKAKLRAKNRRRRASLKK
jgi:hypothetical protein